MTKSDKRVLKLLIGFISIAPLSAALLTIVFPEAFSLIDVAVWKRLLVAIFVGFSYCFGLVKWVLPNG